MNMQSDVIGLARDLYVEFAARSDITTWNWMPIAKKAIEAAEVFGSVIDERYPEKPATGFEFAQEQRAAAVAPRNPNLRP